MSDVSRQPSHGRPSGLLAYIDATQEEFGQAPDGYVATHSCPSGACTGLSQTTKNSIVPEDAASSLKPFKRKTCLEACARSGAAWENFCRGIFDPRIKAGCFGVGLLGKVACQNWCYNYTDDE